MIKLPRNIHLWISAYIKYRLKQSLKFNPKKHKHVVFCFADHYEPRHGKVDESTEHKRVDYWLQNYPGMATPFRDSDGNHPKHTFFFPEEEYRPEHINKLSSLCKQGFGEVEVHLHHDNDTPEGLRSKLTNFTNILHNDHGMLGIDKRDNRVKYAFIHGNWALNNSRPDGHWCGVDNEHDILLETGCYADLTMPSAPSDTQTSKINSIYYSSPYNGTAKCHDTGEDVHVGMNESDNLLMIQGPLMLNWGKLSHPHLPPKIENGEFDYTNTPTAERIKLWLKSAIHVTGKGDWIYIKIHSHGADELNSKTILGSASTTMHKILHDLCMNTNTSLHYASSRELYNIIMAAKEGMQGNPNDYRDHIIAPPACLDK
ncbi:MAG: hypothetical protein OEY29_03425 [Gammaproteobacteria bacterium]|nr:hypothetical protein [Gammaproteobacteria bacterium]